MDEWKAYSKLSPDARAKDTDLICKAFTQTFITLDEQLRDLNIKSGSTAVCSLITPSHIFTASVGDSRSVLGQRRGQAIGMSEDHKPELVDERNRIVKAGGFVLYDRVNGELAMSRAMGDFQYKENKKLGVSQQMVICIPDIAVHERCDDDIVMVVACDGKLMEMYLFVCFCFSVVVLLCLYIDVV